MLNIEVRKNLLWHSAFSNLAEVNVMNYTLCTGLFDKSAIKFES